jgi:hypothetical protein
MFQPSRGLLFLERFTFGSEKKNEKGFFIFSSKPKEKILLGFFNN